QVTAWQQTPHAARIRGNPSSSLRISTMMHRQDISWMVWVLVWVSMISARVCQAADVPAGVPPGRTVATLDDMARSLLPTTPISLELRDAEIKDVLRTLGQQFHLNLLVHEESKALVTLSLTNVPLRNALEALVNMANLMIIPAPGGLLEIVPVKV